MPFSTILILVLGVVFLFWFMNMTINTPEQKTANEELAKKKELYHFENILAPLIANADNIDHARNIPTLLEEGEKCYIRYNYGTIYNQMLDLLESNPDKKHIKTLCLVLGRKHYASMRPDKNPTVYDEQAIQNDILTRS